MKNKRVLLFGASERDDVFFKLIRSDEEIKSDDMIIRYTDFDYLRNIYHNGLTEK